MAEVMRCDGCEKVLEDQGDPDFEMMRWVQVRFHDKSMLGDYCSPECLKLAVDRMADWHDEIDQTVLALPECEKLPVLPDGATDG